MKIENKSISEFTKNKSLYRTIKTSLKSIIKNSSVHRKINDLVVICNDIVIDTYMFIRLYILYLYNNKKELLELDEDFISYCVMTLGTRDTRGKQPKNQDLIKELNNFYENEYKQIYNHRKHDLRGLSFVLPYICQTIETCYSNNLKEHFIDRLFRYINIFAGKYHDDWSRDTQMKFHVPTMGKGLRKLIEKRYLVVLINEFNTSKKCCNCWKDNENYVLDGEKQFRILTCKDCEVNIGSSESKKCPMFMTRDLNSCINMISIAKSIIYTRTRPKEFCKGDDN